MSQEAKSLENEVFVAVSNADRRGILDLLRTRQRAVGELLEAFPKLAQPAISRHLRVLRQAGLVSVSPRAQQRIYSLKPGRLREVYRWVSMYREFWSGRLDALEEHLERVSKKRGKF